MLDRRRVVGCVDDFGKFDIPNRGCPLGDSSILINLRRVVGCVDQFQLLLSQGTDGNWPLRKNPSGEGSFTRKNAFAEVKHRSQGKKQSLKLGTVRKQKIIFDINYL